MTENKYELEDLVSAAVEQKPTDFEDAFNNLLVDRLQTAVQNRKIEIAQGIYSSSANFDNNVED